MLQVSVEDMKVGGSGSKRAMGGVTVGDETIRARYVVNAAGGASDKIAKMVRVHPHPHPNPHPSPDPDPNPHPHPHPNQVGLRRREMARDWAGPGQQVRVRGLEG